MWWSWFYDFFISTKYFLLLVKFFSLFFQIKQNTLCKPISWSCILQEYKSLIGHKQRMLHTISGFWTLSSDFPILRKPWKCNCVLEQVFFMNNDWKTKHFPHIGVTMVLEHWRKSKSNPNDALVEIDRSEKNTERKSFGQVSETDFYIFTIKWSPIKDKPVHKVVCPFQIVTFNLRTRILTH